MSDEKQSITTACNDFSNCDIDEDKQNSVTIIPSKLNKHKMRSRFWAIYRINDSTKLIVYGFIHYDTVWDKIPRDIMDVCCIFYDVSFDIPLVLATPFTLLFVLLAMDLPSALTVQGWELLDNRKQCEYLKDTKIATLSKSQQVMTELFETVYDFSECDAKTVSRLHDQVMIMLTKYTQQKENVQKWSDVELVMSFIRYLVNNSTNILKQDPKTWQFVEYFRRYCRNQQYDGDKFNNDIKEKKQRKKEWVSILTKVCTKYALVSYSQNSPIGRAFIGWQESINPSSFKSAYQVGQEIVEPGQFGKAWRCRRKKDKKISLVKCILKARFYRLHRSAQRRQALLIAMQGEIDIMCRLKHKYIVSMEECYEDKHVLYIVMEECKGGQLFDRIHEKQRYKEKDAAHIIRVVLEALFYMQIKHRVVHCDLKPDNILFVNKSENSPIKIIGFGLSKIVPRLSSLRELGIIPYYTAPEIIKKGDYAHGCDMWSVGVIMFVMLFGFPPFYVDATKYYGQREAQAIYRLIKKGFTPRVKRGYGPWFPKKMPVSDESKDLMSRLMQSDTSKRLTAKEALKHPWILNRGKSSKEHYKKTKQNTKNNGDCIYAGITREVRCQFANFATLNGFKHAVTTLFRDKYENMKPQHFQNLKKLFKELDTDGNGTIDWHEFQNGMLKSKDLNLNEYDMRKMFEELDVAKIREINFESLVNAAVHDYLVASDKRLYQAFRDLDDDEDGKIKTSQLKEKIKEMDMYGKADELIKIIDSADLDKDGTIDYEEFLRALHPDFNKTPEWFWGAQTHFDENKEDK